MQAIRTAYHGASARSASRVIASIDHMRVQCVYDPHLSEEQNHQVACDKLREQLGWTVAAGYPAMVCGQYKGCTYWVFMPRPELRT